MLCQAQVNCQNLTRSLLLLETEFIDNEGIVSCSWQGGKTPGINLLIETDGDLLMIAEKICPICHKTNHCGEASGSGDKCWCATEIFPQEIFELVPEELRNKVCICKECLERFKQGKRIPGVCNPKQNPDKLC